MRAAAVASVATDGSDDTGVRVKTAARAAAAARAAGVGRGGGGGGRGGGWRAGDARIVWCGRREAGTAGVCRVRRWARAAKDTAPFFSSEWGWGRDNNE